MTTGGLARYAARCKTFWVRVSFYEMFQDTEAFCRFFLCAKGSWGRLGETEVRGTISTLTKLQPADGCTMSISTASTATTDLCERIFIELRTGLFF